MNIVKHINLPTTLVDKIKKEAEKKGLNDSALMRMILTGYFEDKEVKKIEK